MKVFCSQAKLSQQYGFQKYDLQTYSLPWYQTHSLGNLGNKMLL
jgi:hypothetical protein